MWVIPKTNGCFTLQTGNHGNGKFHVAALFTEPAICGGAPVRAWDVRENPFPFHFRSVFASVSRLNPLWSPREYWTLTGTFTSALDWCFCQNHAKCTKGSKDREMIWEFYFSALGPLTYAVPVCPRSARGRGEVMPLPSSELRVGTCELTFSALFPCLPL